MLVGIVVVGDDKIHSQNKIMLDNSIPLEQQNVF